MNTYPSFDERLDNPTRWQTSLNPHPPLVSGDPTATWLVCACFVVAMVTFLVLFVGLVVVPGSRQ